jgi:hypothetical protein
MFSTIHSLHQKWNQQRAACPTYQTPKTGCEKDIEIHFKVHSHLMLSQC